MVLHHMPGYDEATKEITRRFAARGKLALCPNLYSHEVRGACPYAAAAAALTAAGKELEFHTFEIVPHGLPEEVTPPG